MNLRHYLQSVDVVDVNNGRYKTGFNSLSGWLNENNIGFNCLNLKVNYTSLYCEINNLELDIYLNGLTIELSKSGIFSINIPSLSFQTFFIYKGKDQKIHKISFKSVLSCLNSL